MLYVALLTDNAALAADQNGLTDDGREVILNEDGTWEFRSSDRYANTADGHRVRLKADNTWEYVGNAPLASNDQVRTTILDIKLQKAEFEIHKKKVQKNIREKSQTVFYLNISVSPAAKQNVTIANTDLSRIQVRDNKGKTYPVLSLTPSPLTLAPNSKQTVTVRAKDSPGMLSGAKSMELVLNPGVLGNEDVITLSRNISDIEKKNVEGFETAGEQP
jgi:hypothetical protein